MDSLRGDRRLLHLGTGRTNSLLFSNYPTKAFALHIYYFTGQVKEETLLKNG